MKISHGGIRSYCDKCEIGTEKCPFYALQESGRFGDIFPSGKLGDFRIEFTSGNQKIRIDNPGFSLSGMDKSGNYIREKSCNMYLIE
jgi:hypothetical protein